MGLETEEDNHNGAKAGRRGNENGSWVGKFRPYVSRPLWQFTVHRQRKWDIGAVWARALHD